GDLDHQEAQRPARGHGARDRHVFEGPVGRPAARRLPGRAHRRALVPRRPGRRRAARRIILNARVSAADSAACVVSPNVADAALAVGFLADSGIQARAFGGLRELAHALDETTGCLVLVEEALIEEDLVAAREALASLPAWRDLPLIVVA